MTKGLNRSNFRHGSKSPITTRKPVIRGCRDWPPGETRVEGASSHPCGGFCAAAQGFTTVRPITMTATHGSRYTFRRIEDRWYLAGFALSVVGLVVLTGANLWDVFITRNGEALLWWPIVALVVMGVWWQSIQEIEKRSDQTEWANWRSHETLHSNSTWEYTLYQGTKVIFTVVTIVFALAAIIIGWSWLNDTTSRFSPGEQAIVALLVAIFCTLFWIGRTLAKR